jgi:hypothetical protein
MERSLKKKQQITNYFDSQTLQNVSLKWEPEFVEVAQAEGLQLEVYI